MLGSSLEDIVRKLAVIPAISGSKLLPGKNKKLLGGMPLIQWTIDAAKKSKIFDEIIISTDDPDLIELASSDPELAYQKRVSALAGDEALLIDVLLDLITKKNIRGWICVLQPTSPLRSDEDIVSSFRVMESKGRFVGVGNES